MARWLGIDFSATAVRVALVSSTYRKWSIEALREERVLDHDNLGAALKVAVAGLRADTCAAAIDGRKGFTRRIELPRAALKDLQNVLSFEVEATLPFELTASVMDHRRVKSFQAVESETLFSLFAGVAAAADVRERIDIVKEATGLDPARIGIGPLPLLNLGQIAPDLGTSGPVAMIELTEESCDVLIVQAHDPRFSRSLSRGTLQLPTEAPLLARELKQTLAAWRASGGEALESVIVLGPGAETPGLENFMQTELGLTLKQLPALAIEVAPELTPLVPRFARALALALSLSRHPADLNLRQGALEAQQSYRFLREKLPLLAGLAAALIASFGFAVFAEQRSLAAQKAGLEDQLAAVTSAYLGTASRDPKETAELLTAAIAGKSDDPLPALDGFDVLTALSERIPQEVVHDIVDLDFKKNQVSIKGLVNTIEEANTVEKKVAEHPCFKEVDLSHTTKLKEKNKQKYSLELKVDCGKPKAERDKKSAVPKPSAGAAE